eukprot:Filipodium_phascolosomae@DN3489_c0_g1_i1.p1
MGHTFNVIVAYCAYIAASLCITILNKVLFSTNSALLSTWLQQMLGLPILLIMLLISDRSRTKNTNLSKIWNTVKTDMSNVYVVMILFVGMIIFNNLCLEVIPLSTYQTARSTTILFTAMLSMHLLKQKISLLMWCACMISCFGLFIGSMDPETLSLRGILFGTVGSLFYGLFYVEMKKCLPKLNNDVMRLNVYNNLASIVALGITILVTSEYEEFSVLPLNIWSYEGQRYLFFLFLCSLSGSAMSYLTTACIKLTSPMILNTVGNLKACLQSVGGFVLLGEAASFTSVSGICLTLMGSFAYGYFSHQNSKLKQKTDLHL